MSSDPRESTEAAQANLIHHPVERRARCSCVVIAAAEFILVGNGIDVRVYLVDIRAHAGRLLFNTRIYLGNNRDAGTHLRRIGANLDEEIRDRADAKIYPLAEVCVLEIAELQILARIEAGVAAECRDRRIVKAGPAYPPSL